MKLLLASGSKSRAMLLNQASIPFNRIAHTADEESIAYDKPLAEIIPIIVELKMNHVALPQVEQFGDSILVLCADTMGATADGTIFAKPRDYHDAVRMIKAYRNGATVGTGFILRKYYRLILFILVNYLVYFKGVNIVSITIFIILYNKIIFF